MRFDDELLGTGVTFDADVDSDATPLRLNEYKEDRKDTDETRWGV